MVAEPGEVGAPWVFGRWAGRPGRQTGSGGSKWKTPLGYVTREGEAREAGKQFGVWKSGVWPWSLHCTPSRRF